MFFHLEFIMTDKTKVIPGTAQEKCGVHAGVGVMTACTEPVLKRFVLACKVGQFPYLLVTQQAHLSLGQSKHVLLIGTMGAVADRADTGRQRPVNVVSGKLRPLFLVTPIAKVRSG